MIRYLKVAVLSVAALLIVGSLVESVMTYRDCPHCHRPLRMMSRQQVGDLDVHQYKCDWCSRAGRSGYVQDNYRDGVLVSGTPSMYERQN